VLDLHANNLESLPKEISTLENLEKLVLEANALTNLPEEIGELTSLRHLNLNCNFLKKLPTSLSKLNLEEFYIIENSDLRTSLYEEIEYMKTLRKVRLDGSTLDAESVDYVRDMLYFCDKVDIW